MKKSMKIDTDLPINAQKERGYQAVPSSIMRKFVYKSGRTKSAQGREPALDYPIAEGRERVKGGEAACEALDVSSVFCYQPAMSSCISRCFMFMYFLPPHWVPAT